MSPVPGTPLLPRGGDRRPLKPSSPSERPDGRRDVTSDLGERGSVDEITHQEAGIASVRDNHHRPTGSACIWHRVGSREPALRLSQTASTSSSSPMDNIAQA